MADKPFPRLFQTVGALGYYPRRSCDVEPARQALLWACGGEPLSFMEFNVSEFAPNRAEVLRLLSVAADLTGLQLERAAQGWRAAQGSRPVAARRAQAREDALGMDTPGVAELLGVMNTLSDLVEGAGMLWDVEADVVSDARKCLLDTMVGRWTREAIPGEATTLLLMSWEHAAF